MIRLARVLVLIAAMLPSLDAVAARESAGAGMVDVDYFSPSTDPNYGEHLWAVEEHHYKKAVDWLKSDHPTYAKEDIEFMLNHFPNHPKALALAIRYGEKTNNPSYAVPLYQRAVKLNPKIAVVWSDFGTLQHTLKNYTEAVACFEKAIEINGKNGIYQYNLGLSLFEQKDYERAQVAANTARDLGVPFTALQEKLDALKQVKALPAGKKAKPR